MTSIIVSPLFFRLTGAFLNFSTIGFLSYFSSDSQSFIFLAFASANLFGVIIRMGQGNSILSESGSSYTSSSERKVNSAYIYAIKMTFLAWVTLLFLLYTFGNKETLFGGVAALPIAILNLTASLERAKRDSLKFTFYGFVLQPLSWFLFLIIGFFLEYVSLLQPNYTVLWLISLWVTSFIIVLGKYRKASYFKGLNIGGGYKIKFSFSSFSYGVLPFLFIYVLSWVISSSYSDYIHNLYEISYRLFSLVLFPLYVRLYSKERLGFDSIEKISNMVIFVSIFITVMLCFSLFIYSKLIVSIVLSFGLSTTIFIFSLLKDHFFVGVIGQVELWRRLSFPLVPLLVVIFLLYFDLF
ncbi:hypothetical protein FCV60_09215 [Vibrio sp. F13]|uniref:hypothetical protein n=1 Tax=Vibrio sp. F13 TaxID=2070777 RepID=UPI0010BDE9D1|nr:hypothetical protein [Vibrio sp. F13]TKF54483.1 hypothetical protein FCV60_09215 [Vibrio sp. F13]